MTYGIPVTSMPVTSDGKVKNAMHCKWLSMRRTKETSNDFYGGWNENKVDIPALQDCLVGKGKPYQQHPGNHYMRFLVDQKIVAYMEASKREKAAMTWQVVKDVQASSGRFLKKGSDDWWIETTDQEARDKVRQS